MIPRKYAIVRGVILGMPLALAGPLLFTQTPQPFSESVAAHVAFIGCPSDGQLGPKAPPRGRQKALIIPIKTAQHLAWYQMDGGPGVLGPRGWQCFGTYGSNGATLYVSPQHLGANELIFQRGWNGFEGPAIQISEISGGTSGRFEVAETIARVFPAHMDFVRNVIAEGIEPSSEFPTGSFPDDKLAYRSNEIVEFETPADHTGLGTASRLVKGNLPIRGVAILVGGELNLVQLFVRLPADASDLSSPIIQQTERESATTGAAD